MLERLCTVQLASSHLLSWQESELPLVLTSLFWQNTEPNVESVYQLWRSPESFLARFRVVAALAGWSLHPLTITWGLSVISYLAAVRLSLGADFERCATFAVRSVGPFKYERSNPDPGAAYVARCTTCWFCSHWVYSVDFDNLVGWRVVTGRIRRRPTMVTFYPEVPLLNSVSILDGVCILI